MSTFEIDQRPREVTMTGEALCAYLRSQAWEDFGAYTSGGVTCRRFALGRKACDVPMSEEHRNHGRLMVEAIDEIARAMGRHSMDVVDGALLAPPAEGPALQWAHASAPSRARPIALLDKEALELRADAQSERDDGRTIEALRFEGEAMEMEAAAAVLRGGGR